MRGVTLPTLSPKPQTGGGGESFGGSEGIVVQECWAEEFRG